MAVPYNHKAIEKKWKEKWAENPVNPKVDENGNPKKKYYCLDMFPYPSGNGLHVGHWRGYVISDVWSRYKLQQGYYIIHPLEVQKQIIDKILSYWQEGYGKVYNPDRADALSRVLWQPDIASAVQTIAERTGKQPYVVTTDARIYPNTVSYSFMRKQLQEGDRPVLLLFGTGFGIEAETMAKFDYILEPVYGPCDYNHLCVRSAAAIILDRLAGEAWWEKN